MSNLVLLISLPIGILGFLFLFWRRIKEDYSSNQIFSFSFIVVGFMMIGFFIGFFLKNYIHSNSIFNKEGIWFWLTFGFGAIGFEIAFIKFKLRFFETLEGVVLGFIFFIFTISLVNSINKVDVKLLLYSIILGSLMPIFFFLDRRYRSFTWYKSGKIGFAGLASLGILFLIRSLIALIYPAMLSFIGKFDAILDILISFVFFIILFKLSEND
jgi:hypothetical protein